MTARTWPKREGTVPTMTDEEERRERLRWMIRYGASFAALGLFMLLICAVFFLAFGLWIVLNAH